MSSNIASQCRIDDFSRWRVSCNTETFHQSRDPKDLCFTAATSQRRARAFTLSSERLHSLAIHKDKLKDIFSNTLINNGTTHVDKYAT